LVELIVDASGKVDTPSELDTPASVADFFCPVAAISMREPFVVSKASSSTLRSTGSTSLLMAAS
jgi:hypothetical protein